MNDSATDWHPEVSISPHLPLQIWVFDPNGGTPEERAAAEAARRSFSANRHKQKHSADMLLRIQFCGAAKSTNAQAEAQAAETQAQSQSPSGKKKGASALSAEEDKLQAHIHKAIEFYSQLQAEDGHFPGDYGG